MILLRFKIIKCKNFKEMKKLIFSIIALKIKSFEKEFKANKSINIYNKLFNLKVESKF